MAMTHMHAKSRSHALFMPYLDYFGYVWCIQAIVLRVLRMKGSSWFKR